MDDKEIVIEPEFIHVYVALQRKKENEIDRKICFRQEIYDEKLDLEILKTKCQSIPGIWRIYKTVNKRDVKKAKKLLQIELINDSEKNIPSLFRTCLLQPKCKAERRFLLDLDDKSQEMLEYLLITLSDSEVTVVEIKETPNGFHLITELFDTRILEKIKDIKVEIKRDAYIFVELYSVTKINDCGVYRTMDVNEKC